MPRKKSVITEKQQTFANTLLETGSGADAARASGQSPGNAVVIERQQGVQAALAVARQELEDISTLRRVDVLNGFMEAIDMGRLTADPNAMISGWDKVAKMMGYYAPETKRVELSSDQANVAKKLEALSDAELLDMLQSRSMLIDVNNDN